MIVYGYECLLHVWPHVYQLPMEAIGYCIPRNWIVLSYPVGSKDQIWVCWKGKECSSPLSYFLSSLLGARITDGTIALVPGSRFSKEEAKVQKHVTSVRTKSSAVLSLSTAA